MIESILKTIRDGVGLGQDDSCFDNELLIHINSAFFTLNQIGVGDGVPFVCRGEEQTWAEFFSTTDELEAIKDYVICKTKMVFDPPSNSYVLDSLKQHIAELEWRINEAVDYEKKVSKDVRT